MGHFAYRYDRRRVEDFSSNLQSGAVTAYLQYSIRHAIRKYSRIQLVSATLVLGLVVLDCSLLYLFNGLCAGGGGDVLLDSGVLVL